MAIFNQFPWVKYNEYNLDWVIRTVKSCQTTVASALTDVSNAVATYFAQHIDTTLTQSGEAADAATVGGRFTTINGTLNSMALSISGLGTRMTNLETAAPKTYVFEESGGALTLKPYTGKTEAETAALLETDMTNNTGVLLAISGSNYDGICGDIDYNVNNHVISMANREYSCRYDLSTATGTAYSRMISVLVNNNTASYVYGDYQSLDHKYAPAVMPNDIKVIETGSPAKTYLISSIYKDSNDIIYLVYANHTIACASDDTLVVS